MPHSPQEETSRHDACLDSAFKEGSIWGIEFRQGLLLQKLRGDPHFESILQKIGPAINQPREELSGLLKVDRLSAVASGVRTGITSQA